LDGMRKTAPFPVFYAEELPSILWTLDWKGLSRSITEIRSKRERVATCMTQHRHLPNSALASLCGCSLSGIEKARRRASPAVSPPIITHDRTFRSATAAASALGADNLRDFASRMPKQGFAGRRAAA
jgi:hypothetical protein